MNELQSQAAFVAQSVWRLLAQTDRDPLSATHGCAHLAYWRDKTSDVADARRQESMLALALLFSRDFPGSSWRGDERLLTAIEALLGYWRRSQYPDGSLDEWYKGERAFAAAAFTTFAVSRTLMLVGDLLPTKLVEDVREGLHRTGNWLCGRNDLFKTNHQAVGVGALAFAGHVLDCPHFTENARKKLSSILAVQTPEGWFPEVGRMDVGYTFLTVEYAAMAMDLWEDYSQIGPFSRAFDFACRFVHPDLTSGEEYGICRNPYVSRIAAILLSPMNPLAATLRRGFERAYVGPAGLTPTLADDLRLSRWAFQPLTAIEYAERTPAPSGPEVPLPLAAPQARTQSFPQAGHAFLAVDGRAVLASACAGAMVRLFGPGGAELTEFGYALEGQPWATNMGYRPGASPRIDGEAVLLTSAVSPVVKFMPSYLARIVLRLACSTALGSRLARMGIDMIRKRKGTALNQASPSLAGASASRLDRKVVPGHDSLEINDRLSFDKSVPARDIHVLTQEGAGPVRRVPLVELLPGLPESVQELTVTRTFKPEARWRLVETRAS